MHYQVLFFDEVLLDVRKARAWYKEKSEGLELRFSMAVQNAIQKIIKMPNAYSIRYKNIRIIHTKTFPYNIHFYVDESIKAVVITAIVHKKRNPETIQNRK